MPDRSRRPPPPEWASAQLEALARVDALRVVLDAVARGDWVLDAEAARELRRLLDAAARWSELAVVLAA
jgi:hypothetical protein